MNKRGYKGSKSVLFIFIVTAAIIFFLMSISQLERKSDAEAKKQLEQALRRCTISCYATEGIYPPDVEYMKEHYGLQVDEERYMVIYQVFAENLMPEITVLEKGYEE